MRKPQRIYRVNWDDTDYPKIEVTTEEGITLREAKDEIIEHFSHERNHARMIINRTRELKAADITNG